MFTLRTLHGRMGCRKISDEREAGLEQSVVFLSGRLDKKRQEVKIWREYYPYGSIAKEWTNPDFDDRYRYGYQGQFSEMDTTTGWNHFELREYDAKIGRHLNIDPFKQYYSPYIGMGNNPVSGFDQDGGVVIFINGFRMFGKLPRGERYWGSDRVRRLLGIFGDDAKMFANGEGGLEVYQRARSGKRWARLNFAEIKAQYEETGQLILVSHSMGGAFADGVTEYLEKKGIKVDLHVLYAPYQDWAIDIGDTPAYHFTNYGDALSGPASELQGSDISRMLNLDSSLGHGLGDFNWSFNILRNWKKTPVIEVGQLTMINSSGASVPVED